MAHTGLHASETAADAIDGLRLELGKCQRELEACRRRLGQLERGEVLLAGENRLLEMVARGCPLSEILTAHCRLIEELSSEALCGILLLDQSGNHVEHGAAPSLPADYNEAIHGRIVNAEAGPCGMAACNKQQVIVSDVASDPRWQNSVWRLLALAHELRACWSTPILSCGGNVIATFAVYWRNPRSPTAQDQKLIEQTTHLASIAIERAQAQDALRRSEAYLAEAQRLSLTGSFGLKVATGELVWSDETFCIMGYDRAMRPTLELVFNRVHPDDLSFVRDTIGRATREESDSDFEHRLLMPDGKIKYVHVMARAAKAERGELEFVGAVMDITERKKSEQAVRAAKARFEGIVEIADDAIISVDSHQRIMLFNQGAEKVFGYAQDEVVGKSLDLLIPSRFLGMHKKHVEDFATAREVSRVMGQRRELFGLRKNAEEFPAEASISKLDLGGELVFTVILRDITERKKAAEALRASEHLARGQLEALASSLAALSRESVPEKFLEHVLRIAGEQLDAVGVSVWEMSEQSGCVELAANYQGRVLHLPAWNGGSPSLRLQHATSDHPVWTEFFRTGKHCVYGRIQNAPPWSEVAIDPDGPWHEWRAGMVDNPIVPQMIKDIAASGIVATLNVPMLVADKVAGLFVLCFKQRRPFRQDEIELTRAMANQAMLAIKLMRLSQANRESAVIAERNRMARDMHDTLAQGFTGVIMQLEAAQGAMASADKSSVSTHIERAEALARASLGEARRSVRAMRSRSLLDGTLSTALDDLLKRMTSGTELQAELVVQGDGRPLPPEWEEGLFRIAQESLTNTIKYAQARRFRAALNFAADAVRLQLVDDGRGFDPQAEHEGFGLIGMRERTEQLAGNFILRSSPGQGTEIAIELIPANPANGNHENRQA